MKKYYKQAGFVLLLLIFLILIVLSRTKVLKSINIWTKISPQKEATISFIALSKNFQGKLNLACGKIGKDNKIVIVPQNSLPAIIKIFDKNGQELWTSGVHSKYQGFNVALGDLDGDGKDEIVLGQTKDKSQIFIYKSRTLQRDIKPWRTAGYSGKVRDKQKGKKLVLLNSFEAFKNLPIGVNIALGDVNGDGRAEIIVGTGQGGGPQVKIFSINVGQASAPATPATKEIGNFFAFHPNMRSGVKVAVLSSKEKEAGSIITLANLEHDTQLKIYKFDHIFSLQDIVRIYGKKVKIPTRIFTAHLEGSEESEIITVPEKKVGEKIGIFRNGEKLPASPAGGPTEILEKFVDLEGGANLAFCDLNGNKKDDIVINEKNSLVKVFYR